MWRKDVSRTEIVQRDLASQIPNGTDEARGDVEILQRGRLGDFYGQAFGDVGTTLDQADQSSQPGRVGHRQAGDIDGEAHMIVVPQIGYRQFQRPQVERADHAQLLDDRNELPGRNDLAFLVDHADQRFVIGDLTRFGVDDGLIGQHDPALVEGLHHLFAERDIGALTQPLLLGHLVGDEAVAALCLRL